MGVIIKRRIELVFYANVQSEDTLFVTAAQQVHGRRDMQKSQNKALCSNSNVLILSAITALLTGWSNL